MGHLDVADLVGAGPTTTDSDLHGSVIRQNILVQVSEERAVRHMGSAFQSALCGQLLVFEGDI
jgi:hypothetical protein